VNEVLKHIEADKIKQVIVFNKIDSLKDNDHRMSFVKSRFPKAVWVSAKNGINIDQLLTAIDDSLNFAKKHFFFIPHDDQKSINLLFKMGKILEKDYYDDGVEIKAILNNEDVPYFEKFITENSRKKEEKEY